MYCSHMMTLGLKKLTENKVLVMKVVATSMTIVEVLMYSSFLFCV